MKLKHCVLSALCMGVGTGLFNTALQAEPLYMQPEVRAGIHEDYERLVFEWPQKIDYTFSQNGPDVTLHFLQGSPANLQVIAKRHLRTILHSEQIATADGNNVKLTLAPNIVAEQSQQGRLVILDFYEGTPPVIASAPVQATLIASETSAPPPVTSAPVQAGPETMPKVEPPSLAMQPAGSAPPTAPALDDIGDTATPLVSFDPGILAGVAVYHRADYVYIVFGKKFTLPISSLVRDTPRINLESLQSTTGAVYRFYMPQDLTLRCTRDQSKWTIFATRKVSTAPISLTVTAQPDYALGARVLIPVSKSDEVVRFTDPEIGDDLLIIPLESPSQAMRQSYHYADFKFVPSEQGIVIRPLSDAVNVRRQNLGIEITAEKGLHLSASTDTGIESDARANSPMKDQLFDLNEWYGPSKKTFTEMRQFWQRTLAEVPPNERDRIRLNLARFYFARDHAQEAMGLLTYLSEQVPDLLHRGEFLALRGAVRVLMHDHGAIDDLNAPDIANSTEIKLWKAVAKTQALEWNEAADLFESADSVLDKYPEPYFTDFSIAAVEAAIASKDKQYASKVLDRLVQRHPELDSSSGAVNYLRGVILSITNHIDRAEQYWSRAASGSDQLYRVRAKLSLVDYEVISGKITPLQAAAKLERLRFAWRGDDLELDVLRRLGKFYIEGGKMEDGLATLKQALALLPDNEAAKQLHQDMTFAFRDIFLGSKKKDIAALDALSLYERFYDLAPAGAEGDAIIRSLAQRMVSLDLLDRGATLLADQARHRLSGVIKTRVGTQAAGIFLLDHKANDALSILKDTEDPSAAPDLVTERQLLTAKAYASLDRVPEAKAILKNMNNEYADRMMVDIAWRAHDWADAAQALDKLIGTPPESGMKPETAQLIISKAIALALINDAVGLGKMKAQYSSAMKGMPQEELFKTLTDADAGLPEDPQAMKPLLADVDLFQSYLENYRTLN